MQIVDILYQIKLIVLFILFKINIKTLFRSSDQLTSCSLDSLSNTFVKNSIFRFFCAKFSEISFFLNLINLWKQKVRERNMISKKNNRTDFEMKEVHRRRKFDEMLKQSRIWKKKKENRKRVTLNFAKNYRTKWSLWAKLKARVND